MLRSWPLGIRPEYDGHDAKAQLNIIIMRVLLCAFLIASLPALAAAPDTSTINSGMMITGTVTHVRDGDTIEVKSIPIRLNGISAPEMNEPLGVKSKTFMVDLVLGKHVRCELNGEKTYDRWVGVCFLESVDIGRAVVRAGLALDCPRYSRSRYAGDEAEGAAARMRLPGYCR
ncbi:thermonuclease family protein [Thalassospiraceae bacterium LMO-SO8]|nr:thermonuclease family protein [Alphaproteobacteria bacterium LMO-S08]WND77873.1 thermonuclease family protein [Thalassospiraceae bacterium LMO-SO8]